MNNKALETEIKNIVECLMFVSAKPLTSSKLADVIGGGAGKSDIEDVIMELQEDYEKAGKPVFVQKVAGGWRFATRPEYGKWVKSLYQKETTYRLTTASLETLAIVAYKQPVTLQEIEAVRGVSSGGVLRGLLKKKLVKISGRKEVIGRPILYRTSGRFLEYFGLESIEDLPSLEELGLEEAMEEINDEEN